MNSPRGMQQDPRHARSLASEDRACARPGNTPSLTAEDERFMQDLAGRLRDSGLASASILWLASLRPLSFLGSQVLHVAAPLLDVVIPGENVSRLARILEKRSNLEILLSCLEGDQGPAADRVESS